MITNRDSVTNIIRNNRKRFECSEFMFAEDSNLPNFKGETLKVLALFLSNGRSRSSSNTFNALYSIAKKDNTFIDFCYLPHSSDISLYNSLDIPYLRGARSGFVLSDFDIVLVNVSIFKEIINLPSVLQHDNIPMGYNGRNKAKSPIFVLGGSSSGVVSIAFGKFLLNNKEDTSLVDFAVFGKGEQSLSELFSVSSKLKEEGLLSRSALSQRLSNYFLKPAQLVYQYHNTKVTKELSGAKVRLDLGNNVDTDFTNKVVNLDGSFCDRGDLLISSGCSGRSSCSFCYEGSIGGCWKERSLKDLELDILKLKSNSWCESIGIFSYNANYHTNIYEIAEITKRYFNRTSLLASRADVYAQGLDFIELCKSLGSIKLSIAAEGMSERLRNSYLNKRLPKADYYKAVLNIMSDKILTLKINYILTGKETKEDFEEWVNDLAYFTEKKKELGYVTRLSVTITNLEIYDMTALGNEKRVMALESYNYEDSDFIKEFLFYLGKVKELGVGINLYGVGGISAFDQLVLDLGVMGTNILVNSVVKDGLYYDKDVTRNMCTNFFKRVSMLYSIEDIFNRVDTDTWSFSSVLEYNNKYSKVVCDSYINDYCESCINPYK